jgi:hypothetical protein
MVVKAYGDRIACEPDTHASAKWGHRACRSRQDVTNCIVSG